MPKAQVPQIVAEVDFVNQTSDLPTTVIFPVSVSGEYRVSVYGVQTTSATNAGNATLSWTDEFGSSSVLFQATWNPGPRTNLNTSMTIRAIAGSSITISLAGAATPYSLFTEVEAL